MTSNPTILAKAIAGQDTYDEQFGALIKTKSVEDAYWDLVIDDIDGALGHPPAGLRLVRRRRRLRVGRGGPVPGPRHRGDHRRGPRSSTSGSTSPTCWSRSRPPPEGVPAIRQMISEGRSINVTLIFSIDRYDEVIEAYLSGLEALVASGADDLSARGQRGLVLRQPGGHRGGPPHRGGRGHGGRTATSSSRSGARPRWPRPGWPTGCSRRRFSGPRWEALAATGARVQRPLWASTSTKNPAYPDLAYVDTLIGPDTVNTMPDGTVADFLDHGTVARTVDTDVDDGRRT